MKRKFRIENVLLAFIEVIGPEITEITCPHNIRNQQKYKCVISI